MTHCLTTLLSWTYSCGPPAPLQARMYDTLPDALAVMDLLMWPPRTPAGPHV